MSATLSALLLVTLTCLCLALAGYIAAGDGYSWWRIDDGTINIEVGLWKTCSKKTGEKEICTKFSNVLEFKSHRVDLDVVLLLIILAGSAVVVAIPSAISLFCCQRGKSRNRKCGTRIVAISSLTGAILGFAALGYAEVKFADDWTDARHGWSVIVAWIGTVCLSLACVLSSAMYLRMKTASLPTESFRMDRKVIPTRQTYGINDNYVERF